MDDSDIWKMFLDDSDSIVGRVIVDDNNLIYILSLLHKR